MNPYFSGHLVLFYANYDHQWHLFEFLPFILLGVFGVRKAGGREGKAGGGGGGEEREEEEEEEEELISVYLMHVHVPAVCFYVVV